MKADEINLYIQISVYRLTDYKNKSRLEERITCRVNKRSVECKRERKEKLDLQPESKVSEESLWCWPYGKSGAGRNCLQA
jgi:hypothetical protein